MLFPITDQKNNTNNSSLKKLQPRKVSGQNLPTYRKLTHSPMPVRNFLRPVQRTSDIYTKCTNPELNFTPIATNKNYYKNSFLPHTLVDWNNLTVNHLKPRQGSSLNLKKSVLKTTYNIVWICSWL